MNFEPDVGDGEFRARVRDFIVQNLPPEIAERTRRTPHPSREDVATWMGILHRQGWSAVGWPSEYGGPDWSGLQRMAFEEECLNADAPPQHFANVHSVGPVIYTFGNPEHKLRYLEPLLRGDEFWCQGFSEPNSGSDLASLSTGATREGPDYIVNGQKIWTSDAQDADHMFALVRTNPELPQHRGISFLLINMRTPGITVRPIRLLDGSEVVSEVFFDEVRVDVANRIGAEGQGWAIAKFLLANERAFSAEVPSTKRDLRRLIASAKNESSNGHVLWDEPLFRAKVVRLQADLEALEYTVLRAILTDDHGGSGLASLVKIPGSELRQRVSELMAEALFPYGLAQYPSVSSNLKPQAMPGPPAAAGVSSTYAYRRAATIYGGASEIQREIISKTILRL